MADEFTNVLVCGADPGPAKVGPPLEVEVLELVAGVGVEGDEPVIGGKDSIKEVPNDDDGLNGFNPAKPVICGFIGATEGVEVLVIPVG